jgi:hypothetical protein
MRKIVYIIALLGLATPLFAADPFVGTWKLDPAKSKIHRWRRAKGRHARDRGAR